ncbi:hypothetical protein SE17_01920 [Kouleothrix aurantiaca]|uniref:Uncharacterized protein n=1 Tax=Kouleothrix aurantiaca TaxID=186479 RepID=A0A0P9DMR4_9CHLR|nr:hypothetical protein SE17_01920 [Kouleothrix aurantiaca]
MPPFQDCFLGQVELACELRAGLTVEHATQQQDHLGGQQLRAFEDRASIERIDALAVSAAIDWQTTTAIDTEQARVGQAGLTMWTAKAIRMEMLFDPGDARLGIQQSKNWKIHTR